MELEHGLDLVIYYQNFDILKYYTNIVTKSARKMHINFVKG